MLNARQRRFVESYVGNATQAAIAAGYSSKTAYSNGARLLKNAEVAAAVRKREEQRTASLIANREQREIFWSSVMNDGKELMKHRLRASELLGKAGGDFVARTEVSGPGGSPLHVSAEPERDYENLSQDELFLLDGLLAKLEGDFEPMENLKASRPWLKELKTLTPEEAAHNKGSEGKWSACHTKNV
ncbi:MAG: terminase small subunit [Synergistaceae bacterium]|nr:terminase small subunit [Synergistaceae bacterium]